MTAPIRIESRTPADAQDLLESLVERGIRGRVVTGSGRCEVEVGFEPSENEPLPLAALVALETWLLARSRPSIRVRVGEHRYELRAHPDGSGEARMSMLARLWRRMHVARRSSTVRPTRVPQADLSAVATPAGVDQ